MVKTPSAVLNRRIKQFYKPWYGTMSKIHLSTAQQCVWHNSHREITKHYKAYNIGLYMPRLFLEGYIRNVNSGNYKEQNRLVKEKVMRG